MDEHFDLVAWLARRRRMLDGQKAKAMAEHLTACEKCRRLDELAAHLEVIALQNYQKGERKVADRCPEVETLALYFSGLLPFLKKRRVEQHLAGCDSCRHVLAEMMRAESTTAVSGEESVEPALQSDSHSERVVGPAEGSKHESAAASSELTGIPAQAPGQSALWITLKARWRQMDFRPHQMAVAAVAVLLLTLTAGPKLIVWRSNYSAQAGMKRLAEHHEIRRGELRFAGDFLPAELAPRSGDSAEEDAAVARLLQKSLWWNQNNPIAKRGQALLSYFNGDFATARQGLAELLDSSRNEAGLWNDLGVVAEAAGDTTLALEYFNQALASDATLAAAHYNLAVLLQKLGRRVEAQRAWQRYQQVQDDPAWRRRAAERAQENSR